MYALELFVNIFNFIPLFSSLKISRFYGRFFKKAGDLMIGPDKNKIHPNPNVPSVCFIKNIVKNPNIIIGDLTYYDDFESNGEDFEKHVTHLYLLSVTN